MIVCVCVINPLLYPDLVRIFADLLNPDRRFRKSIAEVMMTSPWLEEERAKALPESTSILFAQNSIRPSDEKEVTTLTVLKIICICFYQSSFSPYRKPFRRLFAELAQTYLCHRREGQTVSFVWPNFSNTTSARQSCHPRARSNVQKRPQISPLPSVSAPIWIVFPIVIFPLDCP